MFNAGFRSNSTPFKDERDFVDGRYSSVTVTVERSDNRNEDCNKKRKFRDEIEQIAAIQTNDRSENLRVFFSFETLE